MGRILKLGVFILLIVFIACSEDQAPDTGLSNPSSIAISGNKILRNQLVSFHLMDGQTDNTAYATFYVNGEVIDGNSFSSATTGTFEVYAEYNLAGTLTDTDTDTFEVYIPVKKALIEGFTGTWCGYCPRLKTAFEKVELAIEDIVLVSIHGNSSTGQNDDPFTISEGMILKDFYEAPGYPYAYLDRGPYWTFLYVNPYPLEEVTPFEGFETDISLGITSAVNNNNLSVEVKVISETAISNTKLVVFLLEDGLLYDQVNYYNEDPESPFYQMGNPIPNYEHNNVLRMSFTDPLGDDIPETPLLEEYKVNFNVAIPAEYNPSKLKLVAILLNGDNAVRNAQKALINQLKDYE